MESKEFIERAGYFLVPVAFEVWLRGIYEAEFVAYRGVEGGDDTLTAYLEELIGVRVSVGHTLAYSLDVQDSTIDLPEWAQRFVSLHDEYLEAAGAVSAAEALDILNQVMEVDSGYVD